LAVLKPGLYLLRAGRLDDADITSFFSGTVSVDFEFHADVLRRSLRSLAEDRARSVEISRCSLNEMAVAAASVWLAAGAGQAGRRPAPPNGMALKSIWRRLDASPVYGSSTRISQRRQAPQAVILGVHSLGIEHRMEAATSPFESLGTFVRN